MDSQQELVRKAEGKPKALRRSRDPGWCIRLHKSRTRRTESSSPKGHIAFLPGKTGAENSLCRSTTCQHTSTSSDQLSRILEVEAQWLALRPTLGHHALKGKFWASKSYASIVLSDHKTGLDGDGEENTHLSNCSKGKQRQEQQHTQKQKQNPKQKQKQKQKPTSKRGVGPNHHLLQYPQSCNSHFAVSPIHSHDRTQSHTGRKPLSGIHTFPVPTPTASLFEGEIADRRTKVPHPDSIGQHSTEIQPKKPLRINENVEPILPDPTPRCIINIEEHKPLAVALGGKEASVPRLPMRQKSLASSNLDEAKMSAATIGPSTCKAQERSKITSLTVKLHHCKGLASQSPMAAQSQSEAKEPLRQEHATELPKEIRQESDNESQHHSLKEPKKEQKKEAYKKVVAKEVPKKEQQHKAENLKGLKHEEPGSRRSPRKPK